MDPSACAKRDSDGWLLHVKVVPGARCDRIAGLLGDRLKVQVRAPPEQGRANQAVCRLIADWVGCPVRRVTIHQGANGPRKTIRLPFDITWPA